MHKKYKNGVSYNMIVGYNRGQALLYAQKWAYARNPKYYDFSKLGGDCTNFASQCLFAGCGVMNDTAEVGWFYYSLTRRAAAWTGVEFFYRFLIGNNGIPSLVNGQPPLIGNGAGPFAIEVPLEGLEVGDFVQMGKATGDFYHTAVVVDFRGAEPFIAAHSNDAYNRPLFSYSFDQLRCLHIVGARKF